MASVHPELQKKKNWFRDFGSDVAPALGFLEVTSISLGLFLTDLLLKKAPVTVACSHPVSSGKHVILFFGEVASVEESYREALQYAGDALVQKILIHSVHPGIVPFLDAIWNGAKGSTSGKTLSMESQDSIGMVESTTLTAAILAADASLKVARVELSRMQLGQGIGGKGFFVLTGSQEELEAALLESKNVLEKLNSYCRTDLIPRPQQEAFVYF